MKVSDVDPKIKRLFPWALFLVTAALLLLATKYVRAEGDIWACYGSQRYQAMSSSWIPCTEMSTLCKSVREYLVNHTVEQGRAEAEKPNVPGWLRAKAERCIQK